MLYNNSIGSRVVTAFSGLELNTLVETKSQSQFYSEGWKLMRCAGRAVEQLSAPGESLAQVEPGAAQPAPPGAALLAPPQQLYISHFDCRLRL